MLLGIPAITLTKRATLLGTPAGYVEASQARTSVDLAITVEAGESRKLVVFVGCGGSVTPVVTISPEQPYNAATAVALEEIQGSSIVLSRQQKAFFLDAPTATASTIRVATGGSTRCAIDAAVFKNALAGPPPAAAASFAEGETTLSVDIETGTHLLDAYSESYIFGQVHGLGTGTLTVVDDRQIAVNEGTVVGANPTTRAISGRRPHVHNGQVEVGWTTTAAPTGGMVSAVIIPSSADQTATSSEPFTLLSEWGLNETEQPFADVQGRQPLAIVSGTVTGGSDPLLADAGKSLGVQNTVLGASNHIDYQSRSHSSYIYYQPRSHPPAGSFRTLIAKDIGNLPGNWGIQHYNDSGVGRLRMFIRNSTGGTGSEIWVGSMTGVGTITLATAYSIHTTYDDFTKTAKLYINEALVATHTDENFHGSQDNPSQFRIAGQANISGSTLDGFIDKIGYGSGVLTQSQINAFAAAVTITDTGPPSPVVLSNVSLGSLSPGQVVNRAISTFATGLTGANVELVETADAAGRMTFTQNFTPTANVRVTMPGSAPASTTIEIATVRAREAGGQPSNEATITWTREVVSGEDPPPFPFVTDIDPPVSHSGIAGRPPFNEANPRAASFIDPMSGLETFRITGDDGDPVKINGTMNSGTTWRYGPLPDNNPNRQTCWNCDASLLLLNEAKDGTGTCRQVLIDVNGQYGNSNKWTPLRVNIRETDLGAAGRAWWSNQNPLKMWHLTNSGQIAEYWPVGGPGHAVGERNVLFNMPSGFGKFVSNRTVEAMDITGRYHIVGCSRNSDGMVGGFRADLINEEVSGPFVDNNPVPPFPPFTPHNDPHFLRRISQKGILGQFARDGDHQWHPNMLTGELFSKTDDILNGSALDGHADWVLYGTHDAMVGSMLVAGQFGFWLLDMEAGTRRRVASGYSAAYSHVGRFTYKDTFDVYPGTGSGSSVGQRYIFTSEGGHGMLAIRIGVNDTNVVRYLGHPRSVRGGDNSAEQHPHPSPGWEYIASNSNWQTPGVVPSTNKQIHTYIIVIPPAFRRQLNSGL